MLYVLVGFFALMAIAFFLDKKSAQKESNRILSYVNDFTMNKTLTSDEVVVAEYLKSLIKKRSIIRITEKRVHTGIHFIEAGTTIFQSGYLVLDPNNRIAIDHKYVTEDHLLIKNKSFVRSISSYLLQEDEKYREAKNIAEKLKKESKLHDEFLGDYNKANAQKTKVLMKNL